MGNIMRIPIQPAPTSFLHWSLFNPAGEPMKKDEWQYAPGQQLLNTEMMFIVANTFCEPLLKVRLKRVEIKNKFLDANIDQLAMKFHFWTCDEIKDLKAEFQLFDTKKHGLIGRDNLFKILADLGDNSSQEVRDELFEECDEGEKGELDFEEYLEFSRLSLFGRQQLQKLQPVDQYVAVLTEAPSGGERRALTIASSSYGSGAVRRLSILNQISAGIF